MIRIILSQPGLLVFLSVFISVGSDAQVKLGKYEFGLGLGMMVYQGDLAPSAFGSYSTSRFGFNLHAGRRISSSFVARGNLLWGRLAGDESKYNTPEYRQQRNFRFNASVKELTAQLVWLPVKEKKLAPYLFGGAGLSSLHINRDWSRINYSYFESVASGMAAALAVDSTHQLPGLTPVFILGGGAKFFITNSLALNAEYSYRIMRTDYLDGFSMAANPDKKDHYMNYSVGLVYHTGRRNRSLDCPVIQF
ncbi:MAG TPA: outer membrane beta-barrel protein [Chitinophagaceae bacterium]|nr:outer membrane beta-barrel protein [Chitinophagaceae bacterium]